MDGVIGQSKSRYQANAFFILEVFIMQSNIHAFTEPMPSIDLYYPAYISLNQHDDGKLFLSVRTRGQQCASEIEMIPEQLEQLAYDIMEHINK